MMDQSSSLCGQLGGDFGHIYIRAELVKRNFPNQCCAVIV